MKTLSPDFHDQLMTRPWTGRWIGAETDGPVGGRALFRRTFALDDPAGARLFISAERDYQLFINGRFICRGAPPSPYYYKYYDEVDVADHLARGDNCIALLVCQIGAPLIGLLADLVDGAGRTVLSTDDAWRVTSRTGWLAPNDHEGIRNNKFQEYFSVPDHPRGWEQPGFDDSAWASPRLHPPLGDRHCPWKRMVPRKTPFLAEWDVKPEAVTATEEGLQLLSRNRAESLSVQLSAPGQPVRYSRIDDAEAMCADEGRTVLQCSDEHLRDRAFDGIYSPSVVLDFGKVVTGYLELEVETEDGGRLDVGYVERLVNGQFNNAIEVPYADCYMMAPGRQTLGSTIWKGFRYVKLRLAATEKPLTIHRVKVRVCTYDYDERGGFESSDPTLNGVFDICRYTIRLCSRDFLMDTPWRERNQWLGDNSAVTLPGIYACFGDTVMPEQFLHQATATPCPDGLLVNNSQGYNVIGQLGRSHMSGEIADYSLYWIQAVWRHYMFTGDAAMVRAVYRHVLGIVHYHWRHMDDRGLVGHFPTWTFIDHVFKPDGPPLTPYNALWYAVLADVVDMARFIGDADTVEKCRQCREVLAANFAEAFFDDDAGLFRDWVDPTPPPGVGLTEHSNLAPLAFGLADPAQSASILDHLYDSADADFLEAEPFFCHVVLRGLRNAGRTDLALDLIRERWGGRMLDKGHSSVVEEWNPSGSFRGSGNRYYGIFRTLSHAWSGCPAEFLVHHLTGFEVVEPGCAAVRLAPFEADFDYAVNLPTPRGDIAVTRKSGRTDVNAPDAIEVR